ncbi:hypothetical protein ACLBWS_15680, partial [Brucellaceae bacterium D45D]
SIHCLVGGLDVRVVNQKNDTPYRKVGILSRALRDSCRFFVLPTHSKIKYKDGDRFSSLDVAEAHNILQFKRQSTFRNISTAFRNARYLKQ